MKTSTFQVRKTWRGCLRATDRNFIIRFLSIILDYEASTKVRTYESLIRREIKFRGDLSSAKFGKSLYQFALRKAAGLEVEPIPFRKSDKDGFPKVIKFLKEDIMSDDLNKVRGALTVLQLYKVIEGGSAPSLSSIEEPYRGETEPYWLPTFMEELERTFPSSKTVMRLRTLKPGLHLSTKNGPNGPALLNAPFDREAIRGTQLEADINELAELINPDLCEIMNITSKEPRVQPVSPTRTLVSGRLRVKYESGGKSRIFAIVDWFSQSALLPLHRFLMDWLGDQIQDGTSNHSYAARSCAEWTDGRFGKALWSFDLTTATDRFPRFLEKIVMSQIFSPGIGDLWERIISNRTFLDPSQEKFVTFNSGQPLGALSSWASFAVTHHILVRTAGRLEGFNPDNLFYRIIGDDICIARDRAVAERYISMIGDLKVPFSREKSVLPSQMLCHPVAELAKRLFRNGDEITPLPPDAIIEYQRDKRQLLELASDRGYARADQVYPVQSILASQLDFVLYTFPIGKCPAPLREVRYALSVRKNEHPPGGIDPRWYIWDRFPPADIRAFAFEYIDIAVGKAMRARQEELKILQKFSFFEKPPYQGGDWKPEPWTLHPIYYIQLQQYIAGQAVLGNESYYITETTVTHYGRWLAELQEYMSPLPLFFRVDFREEKKRTRVLYRQIVKTVFERSLDELPILPLFDASD